MQDSFASLSSSYEAILSEKSVLTSLPSPSPIIKQSMLSLLHALATSPGTAAIASSLLAPAPNARKLRPVAAQLLETLEESSAAVVASALDCLLGILCNPVVAAAFWSSDGGASVQKHIIPKFLPAMNVILFHFIRQGRAEHISAVVRGETKLLDFLHTRCSRLLSESSSSGSPADDI